jgi:hypothetical protein
VKTPSTFGAHDDPADLVQHRRYEVAAAEHGFVGRRWAERGGHLPEAYPLGLSEDHSWDHGCGLGDVAKTTLFLATSPISRR